MKKKKKGYGVLLALTIIATVAGLVTLVPYAEASKASLAGYSAYCTFTPISTILCFLLAGFFCVRRVKGYTEEVK